MPTPRKPYDMEPAELEALRGYAARVIPTLPWSEAERRRLDALEVQDMTSEDVLEVLARGFSCWNADRLRMPHEQVPEFMVRSGLYITYLGQELSARVAHLETRLNERLKEQSALRERLAELEGVATPQKKRAKTAAAVVEDGGVVLPTLPHAVPQLVRPLWMPPAPQAV